MAKIFKKIIFLLFLLALFPCSVWAASLSINPVSGTYEVGDRVTIRAVVSSSTPINAVSGVLNIPTSIFSIESVSKSGSVLNFWVTEPNFSKGAGILSFEGVALGGFAGGTKNVITATLRAVAPGTGTISYKSGQVLANDGEGTDVTSDFSGATYSVIPKKEIPKPVKVPEVEVPEEVEEMEEVDIPQKPPSLVSPEIALSRKFGEQAIFGKSDYENSQVLLTFVSTEGVKVFITGDTDASGEFLMLVPKTLKYGTYKVSAIVIEKDISYSHSSNEIEIKVGSFFSDISMEIRLAILALFLSLLYLILRSYFYLRKNKKLKFFVRSEAKKAEDLVHKSFAVLNEDQEEIPIKKMTLGERDHVRTLKKDLKDAENLIIKELKDIEKS